MILCIETSTDVCSVALSVAGQCVKEINTEDKRQHSSALVPNIEKCLKEYGISVRDLSAVAIGMGPGSYTGLRIGASTAKGICFATKCRFIAISSLQGLAYPFFSNLHARDHKYVMPTIDARRMEVYAAVYSVDGRKIKETHNLILDQHSVNELNREFPQLVVCGNGAQKMTELIDDRDSISIQPSETSAANLCSLAHQKYMNQSFTELATFAPDYYKQPNITVSTKGIL